MMIMIMIMMVMFALQMLAFQITLLHATNTVNSSDERININEVSFEKLELADIIRAVKAKFHYAVYVSEPQTGSSSLDMSR